MSTLISGVSPVSRALARDAREQEARFNAQPALDAEPAPTEVQVPDVQAQIAEVESEAANVLTQFGRLGSGYVNGNGRARRSEDIKRILDADAEDKVDELFNVAKYDAASAKILLREARQRFRDDSDLILALRELRRRRKLDGEPVDVVESAMEEVMREGDARQIKAGINVALKAKVYGRKLRLNAVRLRQLYRQFLESDGAHVAIYEDWIMQFGTSRRKRVVEYIGAALVCDMHSLDPSCGGAVEFGPLLGTLNCVRMLTSADELFIAHFLGASLGNNCLVTEERALALMLGGLQSPFEIDGVLLEHLGANFASLGPEGSAQLMQLVLRSFAGIPIALYGDADERQEMLSALRAALGLCYTHERRSTLSATPGSEPCVHRSRLSDSTC
ncbi:SepL/TyeA/HrpJ family type III secretion system gatekeeper [Pandoraea horticolens]|uniref:SepL/TyeA/HrpJ family type III secretion system gatekeeper n=1 Tax=Pandoraea horticolens TaxID=2508298 RepID=A0A5E4XL36_9BURK|nr:type III secretion system gatekeeper subunit SctW [Pandoraea horticolens]VVE37006.1 SepL/TyeA/HrpJ family type III secretion system gatekeeper [Pandoraea horticolens]